MISPSASLHRFISKRNPEKKERFVLSRTGGAAGQSAAARHILSEDELDINRMVAAGADKTFLIRVKGDSMINANIRTGDVLLVNRGEEPASRDIVVAEINKKLLVKRLVIGEYTGLELHSENENYPPIVLEPGDELKVWGVVKSVIKTF